MTANKSWTLTCDGCGEIFDGEEDATLAECRKESAHFGWHTKHGKPRLDFCRHCDPTEAN